MESLFFSIFVEVLYADIHFSDFILLACDLKTFHVMKHAKPCKLLHSDMDSVKII
jgi:hypothetical protein